MPTATYIPLATITLSSSDASIDFASIPSTYKSLVLVIDSTGSAAAEFAGVYFNSDTTNSNYSRVAMFGSSSGTASINQANPYIHVIYGSNRQSTVIQIEDYSATDKHKTALSRTNNAGQSEVGAMAMRWANTSAINAIKVLAISGTFSIGSTFSLYGIAG